MNKIIVIGTTGSGKTTLAKEISTKLKLPHIQLDSLFWKPNWEEASDQEFFSKIRDAIRSDQWVVDGNYSRTQSITLSEADTVVWIDLPFWQTFYQLIFRTLGRIRSKQELWENTGNKESLKMMFSRDSILLWFFKTYHRNRKKYLKMMSDSSNGEIRFIHLKSNSEKKEFLQNIQ
ncbi:MAG: AAA family ATPase [Bdellovibrionales bacterium]